MSYINSNSFQGNNTYLTDKGIKMVTSFLKRNFSSKSEKSMKILRDLSKLERERAEVYRIHLKSLDDRISNLKKDLKVDCSHPELEVEHSRGYNDDGEGNSWSWSDFTLRCFECSFRKEFIRNDDPNPNWKDPELEELDNLMYEKDKKERSKEDKIRAEESERKQFEKLSKKYGGSK